MRVSCGKNMVEKMQGNYDRGSRMAPVAKIGKLPKEPETALLLRLLTQLLPCLLMFLCCWLSLAHLICQTGTAPSTLAFVDGNGNYREQRRPLSISRYIFYAFER